METIYGVEERVETTLGDSIRLRDETISRMQRKRGLGPPNLVHLVKGGNSSGYRKSEGYGYYHFILG